MRRFVTVLPVLLVPGLALASGGESHEGGIPVSAIAVHAANFVLMYAVIFFAARKPVADMLKQRSAGVKKAIDDANAARKAAQERVSEIEGRLSRLDAEVESMRAQAADAAQAELEHSRKVTAQDIENLKALTALHIQEETNIARQTLQAEAVDLAMKLAEERIRGQINAQDHQRFAGEFLKAVKDQEVASA